MRQTAHVTQVIVSHMIMGCGSLVSTGWTRLGMPTL